MSAMPFEKTDGMIRHTRLHDESREYLERREELRRAEVDLIHQIEKVAALRRSLPQGTPVQDYQFLEGPEDLDAGDTLVRPVRLSELFSTPTRRPLIIYHFMYGKKQTLPCPMCTMMIDGFNGIASHLAQNVDFAIVAAAEHWGAYPARIARQPQDEQARTSRAAMPATRTGPMPSNTEFLTLPYSRAMRFVQRVFVYFSAARDPSAASSFISAPHATRRTPFGSSQRRMRPDGMKSRLVRRDFVCFRVSRDRSAAISFLSAPHATRCTPFFTEPRRT